MNNTWMPLAQEALRGPGFLEEIYGDLTKPGVRQVGKALASILGLGNTILWPVTWGNERLRIHLENNLENYRQQLQHIPEEQIVPVAPELGVPIAEKLAYVRDEKLSDLYITLLSNASKADTLPQAHPSFVNVINNLSADEALLLEHFFTTSSLPFLQSRWRSPDAYTIACKVLVSPQTYSKLTYPDNIPAYASNLEGLGLLQIRPGLTITDTQQYELLKSHWAPRAQADAPNYPERTLRFDEGTILLTDYGAQFTGACHNK